jgi:hypothetical protein
VNILYERLHDRMESAQIKVYDNVSWEARKRVKNACPEDVLALAQFRNRLWWPVSQHVHDYLE